MEISSVNFIQLLGLPGAVAENATISPLAGIEPAALDSNHMVNEMKSVRRNDFNIHIIKLRHCDYRTRLHHGVEV